MRWEGKKAMQRCENEENKFNGRGLDEENLNANC